MYKNLNMKIFEIGVGIGGVLFLILEVFGGFNGIVFRFESYIFIDISVGYFEKVCEKLVFWVFFMYFSKFNIEEELVD